VVGGGRHALEAGDDGHRTRVERVAQPLRPDLDDLGLAVLGVGDDACLRAGEAHRTLAAVDDRHAQQRDRDPLTRREQHVHLSGRGRGRDRLGEALEVVGRLAHRRDDDDDVVPGPARRDDVVGDGLDALGTVDGRAAVLLHDEAHTHDGTSGPRVRFGALPTRPRRTPSCAVP